MGGFYVCVFRNCLKVSWPWLNSSQHTFEDGGRGGVWWGRALYESIPIHLQRLQVSSLYPSKLNNEHPTHTDTPIHGKAQPLGDIPRLLESGTDTHWLSAREYIPHSCDGRGEFFFHKNQFWYKTLVLKKKNLIKNPPQCSPLLQVQHYWTSSL